MLEQQETIIITIVTIIIIITEATTDWCQALLSYDLHTQEGQLQPGVKELIYYSRSQGKNFKKAGVFHLPG